MKFIFFSILIFCIPEGICFAQSDTSQFDPPEILGVVNEIESIEFSPTVSADGKTLIF